MKFQSVIVISLIAVFVTGSYFISKYLQQRIRPRESLNRLLLFMISCLLLVFILSFCMIFIITRLFPEELIK